MHFVLCQCIFMAVMVESMLLKPTHSSNFELVNAVHPTKADIPIAFYRSKKTGLNVIIAQVEGPLVHGFFTVVTEAHDDDGLPHTLEHLVFLGSEEYPYKGILDLFANRCLAAGTNAWTDTDHTSYTVETGGAEGFLNILPVYIDHLLYPTLNDSGFITEVYHVTEGGEDAGVVYSEMQARENSASSRVWLEMLRSLFAKPSGYCSETGGIMKNLRESTSIDKIRKYHREMYRPENLHVIISGQIEPKEVFDSLSTIEAKILSKGPLNEFSRPWQTPVPHLKESIDREILFASETEDTGSVCMGWRGPSLTSELKEFQSLEILMKYLTKSSVSLLQSIFVEKDDPLASEIEVEMLRFSTTGICLYFEGVPSNRTQEVMPVLTEKLHQLATGRIPFDTERMRDIIHYVISHEADNLETEPHETVAKKIISSVLYGNSNDFIVDVVNKVTWLDELLTKDTSYWLNLLQKYLINKPSVVIRGIPSITESKRIHNEATARVEDRRKVLGSKGLKELGDMVSSATLTNEAPIPDDILNKFPVAAVDRIKFHSLEMYSNLEDVANGNNLYQKGERKIDLKDIPVKMQLNHIKSNFVQLTAILDCSGLTVSEKMYLPLLLDLIMESSIRRGDTIIPHEQVVRELNADTFLAKTTLGVSLSMDEPFSFGKFFTNAAVNLRLEPRHFVKGIYWLKDILFNVELKADRVRVKVNKLLTTIGDLQRKGRQILTVIQNHILFKPDSVPNASNCLRQAKFLRKLLSDLELDPNQVLKPLLHVYKKITDPNNILVQVSTNIDQISDLSNFTANWKNFFEQSGNPTDYRLNALPDKSLVDQTLSKNYITSLGSLESAFMSQTSVAIADFYHPDLPALKTAIAYLTQLEGPMWKDIRGKGLAYNFRIILDPIEGLLKLHLGYAAQLGEAYKEAIKLIKNHIENRHAWNHMLFESGKSSLMYEVINQQGYISDVIQLAIYNQYKNITLSYHKDILTKISQVTMDEMVDAAIKYFKPLIDPKTSAVAVVCPPSKILEIKSTIESYGHHMETLDNVRESVLSNL